MRPGVPQRIFAGDALAPAGDAVAPDRVALLAHPPAELFEPVLRAFGLRVRGARDLVDVDLREALDHATHFVCHGSCDVLEAAAIRILVTHEPMIARGRPDVAPTLRFVRR
jgi:hypothetical protein